MGLLGESVSDHEWLTQLAPLYQAALPVTTAIDAAMESGSAEDPGAAVQNAFYRFPVITHILNSLPSPTSREARRAKTELELALNDYVFGCKLVVQFVGDLAGGLRERLSLSGFAGRAAAGRATFQKVSSEAILRQARQRMSEVAKFVPTPKVLGDCPIYIPQGQFAHIVAVPAWREAVSKDLFGRRFVLLGRALFMVDDWVYQQGGALGYGLKGHPGLLGKLLGYEPAQAEACVENSLALATRQLAGAEGEEKTLYELWLMRAFRAFGVDFGQSPTTMLERVCLKRMDLKFLAHVVRTAFHEGAILGYHLPSTFAEYWGNHYRMRPDSEWQKARAHGLQLSEVQEPRLLETAVVELAELAAAWATDDAYHLVFTAEEINLLEQLAARETISE